MTCESPQSSRHYTRRQGIHSAPPKSMSTARGFSLAGFFFARQFFSASPKVSLFDAIKEQHTLSSRLRTKESHALQVFNGSGMSLADTHEQASAARLAAQFDRPLDHGRGVGLQLVDDQPIRLPRAAGGTPRKLLAKSCRRDLKEDEKNNETPKMA